MAKTSDLLHNYIHLFQVIEWKSQTVIPRYREKHWETVARGRRPSATVYQSLSTYRGTTD